MVMQKRYTDFPSILFIKSNMFFPAHGVHILHEKDVKALLTANDFLEETDKYLKNATQETEKFYKEQYALGYNSGKEEGSFEHALKIFGTIFSSIKFVENIETTLVRVVTEAVNKIVGEVDTLNHINDWIQKDLLQLQRKYQLTLYISHNDEKSVTIYINTLCANKPQLKNFLHIVLDDSIKPGNCRVESELGNVEARIKTQMKALEQSLGVSTELEVE